MTCADCGEDVIESERPGVRYCYFCKKPLHGECSMTTRGAEDACENCYSAEATRFTLVMAQGTGEGRDPIAEEGEVGYERPLPGSAVQLRDVSELKPDEDVGVSRWDAELEAVGLELGKDAIDWFAEGEE